MVLQKKKSKEFKNWVLILKIINQFDKNINTLE